MVHPDIHTDMLVKMKHEIFHSMAKVEIESMIVQAFQSGPVLKTLLKKVAMFKTIQDALHCRNIFHNRSLDC